MKNSIHEKWSELKRKIFVLVMLFFDLFRREKGYIKRNIGNHIMYLDPNDAKTGISQTLRRMQPGKPDREPCFMHILKEEVKSDMVTLDLGANIGYITLIMAEIVGKKGKVYALEPDENNFKILTENIKLNGYKNVISPYHLGGSNKTGNLIFYRSSASNLGSMTKTKHANIPVKVPVTTMDEFFKDKEYPNFIKMDIEGHEVEVLESMCKTFKDNSFPTKILMEVHPQYYSENHNLEIELKKLVNIGFKTKYVVSAGIAEPAYFIENNYKPLISYDIPGTKLARSIYANVSDEHMFFATCGNHRYFNKKLNKYTNHIVRALMLERN